MLSSDVLVLNSMYMPISITSAKKVLNLLYKGKAKVVSESEKLFSTSSITLRIPSVISVAYNKVPRKSVRFSKLNVLYRDDQTCAYCGKQFPINKLTIDHVIPVSKFSSIVNDPGKSASSWTNCVCACESCNVKKGNKLLSELGWVLKKQPVQPQYIPFLMLSRKRVDANGWEDFCGVNVRVVELIES